MFLLEGQGFGLGAVGGVVFVIYLAWLIVGFCTLPKLSSWAGLKKRVNASGLDFWPR